MIPVLILLLSSCFQNSPYQGKGLTSLQGSWVEDTTVLKTTPARTFYTRYHFKFTCDSVYMVLRTHAGQDHFASPCYNHGNYSEYVKATYVKSHDSLVFTGVFTHPNFKMKVSGCYRSGNIRYWFLAQPQTSPDRLVLRNTGQHGTIYLRRESTCTCVPRMIDPDRKK